MNCQRSMNCPRCGSTMIFKKFCDYGGYSCGWKCIRCGEIIDEVPENPQRRERKQEWEKALSDDVGKGGRMDTRRKVTSKIIL